MLMKKVVILTSLFFCFSSAFAQGWVRYYGDLDFNQSWTLNFGMKPTTDGGFIMAGGQRTDSVAVIKTDADGTVVWEYMISGEFETHGIVNVGEMSTGDFLVGVFNVAEDDPLSKIYQFDNGGMLIHQIDLEYYCQELIIGANDKLYSYTFPVLFEFTLTGETVWSTPFAEGIPVSGGGIKQTMDNGFIIHGNVPGSGGSSYSFVEKLDATGTREWLVADSTMDLAYQVEETTNGEFVVAGEEFSNWATARVRKYSASGELMWQQDIEETNISGGPTLRLGLAANDEVLITKSRSVGEGVYFPLLYKISADGEMQWSREVQVRGQESILRLYEVDDGGIVLFGRGAPSVDELEMILIKLDEDGSLYSNIVQGNVFYDLLPDCTPAADEEGIANWVVTLSGDNDFAKITNSQGDFYFEVDTGFYQLAVHPVSTYWEPCEITYDIATTTAGDTVSQAIPVQTVVDCPLMDVELFSPWLRPCPLPNSVQAAYCNNGTTLAEDATVEVTLNEWMVVDSFSIAPSAMNNHTYTFEVGDLSPLECGEINIYFQLDCDSVSVGQTLCMEAYATPDMLCIDPIYEGPLIEVDGFCVTDSIRFTIQNDGGDMNESRQYVIIEDNVILLQGDFQLNNGEAREVAVPKMDGATYFLLAQQSPDIPAELGGVYASAAIENCEALPNSSLFNQFSLDDPEPYFDELCVEVTAAYDPNDKQGFPTGMGEDQRIEANVDLDYLIRFQNVGNDTAFTVVIRDQLSEYLDISSLRPGASSHPYELDIVEGRTLKFTFNNILLPDSTTNELASQGYVAFSISQVADNPVGILIKNNSAIFFDGNTPILTNITQHMIGGPFISIVNNSTVVFQPDVALKVYPNPANEIAIFELQNVHQQQIIFRLYDANGQLMAQEEFRGDQFLFHRGGLPGGMYFYQFEGKDALLIAGKLILTD